MISPNPVIQIESLTYAYGRAEAVRDLSLTVLPGRCYGFFGRNGAGKTTTIKCLLNLLRPQSGQVRVFGLDPAKQEVEVKRLLSYVPDQVAFYPWMSVRETLDYLASFRAHWNRQTEQDARASRGSRGHLTCGLLPGLLSAAFRLDLESA